MTHDAASSRPAVVGKLVTHQDAQARQQRRIPRADRRSSSPSGSRAGPTRPTSTTTCCAASRTNPERATSTPRSTRPSPKSASWSATSWGFKIGLSPDGLVGDDGLIEVKARRAKEAPPDHPVGRGAARAHAQSRPASSCRAATGSTSSPTAAGCRCGSSASSPTRRGSTPSSTPSRSSSGPPPRWSSPTRRQPRGSLRPSEPIDLFDAELKL